MRNQIAAALVLTSAALFSAGAHAQAVKAQNGILVNNAGMTLYTFDKDSAGKSACVDQCAKAWPPAMAAADAKPMGDLTVITRDDGSKQWAFKGKPLYLFAKDTKPGDKTGDNFKEIWHVVKQ